MICHCITKVGRREHGKWVSIFLGNPKTTRSLYKYLEKPEEMLENTLKRSEGHEGPGRDQPGIRARDHLGTVLIFPRGWRGCPNPQ